MATKRSVKRPAAKKRPPGAASRVSARARELSIQPASGKPILITDAPGYHVMNNDRVTVLASGRLIEELAELLADVKRRYRSHSTIIAL